MKKNNMIENKKWALRITLSHPQDDIDTMVWEMHYNSKQTALDKMSDMCNDYINGAVREADKFSMWEKVSRYCNILTNNLGFVLEFEVYRV